MTLGRFSQRYDGLLRSALRRRWLTLGTGFGLFALAMAAVPRAPDRN